mmetsp:Transcript_8412/g.21540  ORF Transcript_8412/g.21540 Transcript_8412/m.21540 type:complete len:138 (+) Transcript_8412:977-1390(+)
MQSTTTMVTQRKMKSAAMWAFSTSQKSPTPWWQALRTPQFFISIAVKCHGHAGGAAGAPPAEEALAAPWRPIRRAMSTSAGPRTSFAASNTETTPMETAPPEATEAPRGERVVWSSSVSASQNEDGERQRPLRTCMG